MAEQDVPHISTPLNNNNFASAWTDQSAFSGTSGSRLEVMKVQSIFSTEETELPLSSWLTDCGLSYRNRNSSVPLRIQLQSHLALGLSPANPICQEIQRSHIHPCIRLRGIIKNLFLTVDQEVGFEPAPAHSTFGGEPLEVRYRSLDCWFWNGPLTDLQQVSATV